jgi:DNA-binding MarR family transcriptional regulator
MAREHQIDRAAARIAADIERLARLIRASEHRGGLNPAQWEALRYLSRANRFSNFPGALTRYVGATKGTVSQTVKSLQAKGYLDKTARSGRPRSISLMLTEKAKEALAADPWARLGEDVAELGGKTRRRLARGLSELLTLGLRRKGGQQFGVCADCRYFREKGAHDMPVCMLLDEQLTPAETDLICIKFQAAS